MNLINAMLERLTWEPSKVKQDINLVNNILMSFKNSISNNESLSNITSKFYDFWKYVAEHNIFICVLVLKRYETIFGENDECTKQGLVVINEEIRKYCTDDETEMSWKLLSEIVLNSNFHIIEYTRFFLNTGKLKKVLKYLENTTDFDDCVAFYLCSTCISDVEFRRDVFNDLMSLKWIIDISEIENKTIISEIICRCVQYNDIPSLLNIITLCRGIKLTDFFDKSVMEWKQYLINQYQPVSMILYQKILKSENLISEERLSELYDFALLSARKSQTLINKYLYFAFAITELPQQYDTYLNRFEALLNDTDLLSDNEFPIEREMASAEDTISESANRGLNRLIVDQPFISLIRNNPTKANAYIDIIGEISLYHISKSSIYKKSQTWDDNNNSIDEYKNFIVDFAKNHTQNEVLHLYMNSPLKGVVDFSFIVRLLYQPKEGWVNLTSQLDNYVFRGKLIRTSSDDKTISYRVTLSNAFSKYCFPIHHSWIKYHFDDLKARFIEGEQVYFKIMSINSKGMIFAHDLSPKPQVSKVKQNDVIQTLVVKNIEQLVDGSLSLQGNNCTENIRLFVTAMICDDNDRILVNYENKGNKTIESIPYLPVSNCESTDHTLKRLLKYFLGVHGDYLFSPCGIRHICIGRVKRGIFYIYKIRLSDFGQKQNSFTCKKSTYWRNITEYQENASDEISKSFLYALNTAWSEDLIKLDNEYFEE